MIRKCQGIIKTISKWENFRILSENFLILSYGIYLNISANKNEVSAFSIKITTVNISYFSDILIN